MAQIPSDSNRIHLPFSSLNAESLSNSACLEILDALPTQAWQKDMHNNVQWVNQAVCAFMGQSFTDIVGKNMSELFDKTNLDRINQINQQLVQSGKPLLSLIHVANYHHDGQIRWLKTDYLPLLDDQGKIQSILVLSNDITELHQAKTRLQETTRLFDSFMTHTPIMQWAQDHEARYLMVNPAYQKMMNLTAEQCIGKLPGEVHAHHADEDFINLAVQSTINTLKQNKPLKTEVTIPINGMVYDLFVTKFVFEMNEGEKAVGGIAVDITDLKKTQAELIKIQQRYELAANGTTDGLWDWDLGEYCWYSDRYKRQLGFDDVDAFPHLLSATVDRLHPDDVDKVWQAVDAHLNHSEVYDTEFRLLCKDGTYRWFRSRASATRDETGKPIRMTGSMLDIQDRVMAQEQLALLNRQLEDRVRQRTKELAQARDKLEARVLQRTEQLAHTNELLSIRNQELDQFAHIAAHDLRSPLRTISGFGDFLKEMLLEGDNPQGVEYINRLMGAAFRMEGLIDSLLTFSRVGRSEMQFVTTDLNILLEEVKANLASEILESKACITNAPLPTIQCDATLMSLVFQNLIGNSIRYCVDQAPAIHIRYEPSDSQHVLCITDNGIGFADKDATQIFEPFQRLQGPSRSQTGHGVGLSICKRVIKRHDGKIQAKSQPGKGATFCISLPRTDMTHDQP